MSGQMISAADDCDWLKLLTSFRNVLLSTCPVHTYHSIVQIRLLVDYLNEKFLSNQCRKELSEFKEHDSENFDILKNHECSLNI